MSNNFSIMCWNNGARKCSVTPTFLTAVGNFQPPHAHLLSFVPPDGPLLLNYCGLQNKNAREQKHSAFKLITQHNNGPVGGGGPKQREMQVAIWILWQQQTVTKWIGDPRRAPFGELSLFHIADFCAEESKYKGGPFSICHQSAVQRRKPTPRQRGRGERLSPTATLVVWIPEH